MNKRLKQQKIRLIRRVTLLLLAAWLAVSAAFCAIRLNACKDEMQKEMLGELHVVEQNIFYGSAAQMGRNGLTFLLTGASPRLGKDGSLDRRTQLTISDKTTGDIADNRGKTALEFYTAPAGSSILHQGYLDRANFLASMTDEQRQEIERFLTQSEDYRLVCTQYYLAFTRELVPKKVQLVTVTDEDGWNSDDTVIQTYTLTPDTKRYHFDAEREVSIATSLTDRDAMHRNEIPRDFFLKEPQNDVLSAVSQADWERVDAHNMLRTGFLEYILLFDTPVSYPVYTTGAADDRNGADATVYQGDYQSYTLTYARRVKLWEECGTELAVGVGLLFGFFAVIGTLLCVLLWRMLKNQYQEERKRVSLTNALAHDIKTPLFVIGGYAQHLKENLHTDKRAYYADKIISRTEEVNARVHRMLALSRLDADACPLCKTAVDLRALMEEIAGAFGEKRDFRVICEGDVMVTADRDLLRTALENLADNAVRYSPEGSVVVMSLRDRVFSMENTVAAAVRTRMISDTMANFLRFSWGRSSCSSPRSIICSWRISPRERLPVGCTGL